MCIALHRRDRSHRAGRFVLTEQGRAVFNALMRRTT
jgi:hypothetical protein